MSELRKEHSIDVNGSFARLRKEEFGPFSATADNTARFYVLGFFN